MKFWIIRLITPFLKGVRGIFNLQFTICNLKFIFILLLPFIIAGCGSLIKQPPVIIKYYQIDYPAPLQAKEKIDKTIMVRPINISSTYNRDSLVYTENSFRCGFYQYNQWIAPPTGQIFEKFVRDLQALKCFDAVLSFGSFKTPDLRIAANIEEIGEQRKDDSTKGAVTIHFSVSESSPTNSTYKFILEKTYKAEVPCEKNNPDSLVAAISKAVQIISIDFRKDLQKIVFQ